MKKEESSSDEGDIVNDLTQSRTYDIKFKIVVQLLFLYNSLLFMSLKRDVIESEESFEKEEREEMIKRFKGKYARSMF